MATSTNLYDRPPVALQSLALFGLALLSFCSIGIIVLTFTALPVELLSQAGCLAKGMLILAAALTLVYVGTHILIAIINYRSMKTRQHRLPLVQAAIVMARMGLLLWAIPVLVFAWEFPAWSIRRPVEESRALILSLSMASTSLVLLVTFAIAHEKMERPFCLPGTASSSMTCRVSALLLGDDDDDYYDSDAKHRVVRHFSDNPTHQAFNPGWPTHIAHPKKAIVGPPRPPFPMPLRPPFPVRLRPPPPPSQSWTSDWETLARDTGYKGPSLLPTQSPSPRRPRRPMGPRRLPIKPQQRPLRRMPTTVEDVEDTGEELAHKPAQKAERSDQDSEGPDGDMTPQIPGTFV